MIEDGKFVPKWRYDNLADAARLDYKDKSFADKYKTDKLIELQKEIRDLENKLEQEKDSRCEEVADFQRESDAKITELKNTLFRIKTLADYEKPF